MELQPNASAPRGANRRPRDCRSRRAWRRAGRARSPARRRAKCLARVRRDRRTGMRGEPLRHARHRPLPPPRARVGPRVPAAFRSYDRWSRTRGRAGASDGRSPRATGARPERARRPSSRDRRRADRGHPHAGRRDDRPRSSPAASASQRSCPALHRPSNSVAFICRVKKPNLNPASSCGWMSLSFSSSA